MIRHPFRMLRCQRRTAWLARLLGYHCWTCRRSFLEPWTDETPPRATPRGLP